MSWCKWEIIGVENDHDHQGSCYTTVRGSVHVNRIDIFSYSKSSKLDHLYNGKCCVRIY